MAATRPMAVAISASAIPDETASRPAPDSSVTRVGSMDATISSRRTSTPRFSSSFFA